MYFFKLNLNKTDASLRRTDSVGLEGVKKESDLGKEKGQGLGKICLLRQHWPFIINIEVPLNIYKL